MYIFLRFVLEHAAVDWAAAQSHHLLHQHLQTYSGTNQLSEHLLQRLAGWYIQERISCPSIFFSDWLGGVGPRIFIYCIQHVLLGDLVITEGVHP